MFSFLPFIIAFIVALAVVGIVAIVAQVRTNRTAAAKEGAARDARYASFLAHRRAADAAHVAAVAAADAILTNLPASRSLGSTLTDAVTDSAFLAASSAAPSLSVEDARAIASSAAHACILAWYNANDAIASTGIELDVTATSPALPARRVQAQAAAMASAAVKVRR